MPEGQAFFLTGIRSGQSAERHWQQTPQDVNVYDAKADAQSILHSLGVNITNIQVTDVAPDWYHPGRSGAIQLGPKNILAYFGGRRCCCKRSAWWQGTGSR